MQHLRTTSLLAFLVLGGSACGALFGVDFDSHPPVTDGDAGPGNVADPTAAVDPPEPVGPDGTCATGRKRCDDVCVSKRDPAYGCEAEACTPCSIANGIAACAAGACAVGSCNTKRGDCNESAADGCETNTATSHDDCGACGAKCTDDLVCSIGSCKASCTGGETACSGSCVDTKTDEKNCGICGKPCLPPTNGTATCSAGSCKTACSANYVDEGGTCVPDVITERISAGYAHACGIKTDGTLACWGKNNYGQATPPAGTFRQVSASKTNYSCAVRTDGTVACWPGPLSNGESTPPGGTFRQVSAGALHTCGIKTDGTVACWGYEPGDGRRTPPAGTFRHINAGMNDTCGVKTDGTVACWGYSDYGETLGSSSIFRQVSIGTHQGCGVKTGGSIECWGANSPPPAGTFRQVSWGGVTYGNPWGFLCGLKSDGSVNCTVEPFKDSLPPAGTYLQVSGGLSHACGIKTDGTAVCWGSLPGTAPPTNVTFW